MKQQNLFDGFSIKLLQEETNEWLAHFVELPNVSAYGDTADDALNELAIAWKNMKESYLAASEEIPLAPARKYYSGTFNVRVDKRLHRLLATEAAEIGLSLNALVAQTLALAYANKLSSCVK